MSTYQRMTLEVRCQIFVLLQEGFNYSKIGDAVGFHRSSISNEINRLDRDYDPYLFHKDALKKRKTQRPKLKIRGKIAIRIKDDLEDDLSPEQIVMSAKLEGVSTCSIQTIYNLIRSKRDHPWKKHLRRFNKRGFSRGSKSKPFKEDPHSFPIEERPEEVNSREEFGHWERDCFYIANREQVLVLTERKTRYTEMTYIGKATPRKVKRATQRIFRKLGHTPKSITQDNGPEFRYLEPEPFVRYRCTPHRPDQRGTVENTIGLIRQYIKTKTKWEEIGHKKLKKVQTKLNTRPKKVLGFKTPQEVF